MKTYTESKLELWNLQILKKMLEKSSQFLSSSSPVRRKAWTLPWKLQELKKCPRKTCAYGQPRSHLIRVFNEKSLIDEEIFVSCGWWFSNQLDIVSEAHFSCDTVDRGLKLYLARCCALKRTGTLASKSKVMFFILLILRSDVLRLSFAQSRKLFYYFLMHLSGPES